MWFKHLYGATVRKRSTYWFLVFSQNTEMHALRLTIGKHACAVYALESMLYLTAGIMDKYDNTNIDLETAIFKVNWSMKIPIQTYQWIDWHLFWLQIYSQKQLLAMTMDLLDFVDTRVTLDEHPLNQLIRNSIQFSFDEMNNELRSHIGNEGIRYRTVCHAAHS